VSEDETMVGRMLMVSLIWMGAWCQGTWADERAKNSQVRIGHVTFGYEIDKVIIAGHESASR